MYKVKIISVAVFLATTTTALAGGILTNTNQSVDFLKNPARDAAIGLDGVYSNPAGVVFLPEGFHLAIIPTALSNEPKPFSNSQTPPPPGIEKLNCKLRSPLL